MMKKFLLSILSLALFSILVGAAYIFAPFKMRESINGGAVSTHNTNEASAVGHRSLQTRMVVFHESRIANQPKDAEAYRSLALALITRGETTGEPADYDHAWTELDHAETIEPRDLRTVRARAKLLQSRHRFGNARFVAEQGLKKDAEDTDLIVTAGNAALAMGDFDGAEAHFQKLVTLAPKSQTAWASFSYLAEMRGNLDEAAAMMEKALETGYKKNVNFATRAWLHTILGEIEAKRGKLDVAATHYKLALKNVPDYRLALEFTADMDLWQGNLKSAEEGYRNLLAKQFDPKIQLRLSDLLERQGNKDEAARLRDESLRFYERVVAGGNEGYLRDLATLDLAAGRYGRAAELARRDVVLRPTMESRMLYASVLKKAEAAGVSL